MHIPWNRPQSTNDPELIYWRDEARWAFDVGAALFEAREAKGLTLAQVAEYTLLKPDDIEGMEVGGCVEHPEWTRRVARFLEVTLPEPPTKPTSLM